MKSIVTILIVWIKIKSQLIEQILQAKSDSGCLISINVCNNDDNDNDNILWDLNGSFIDIRLLNGTKIRLNTICIIKIIEDIYNKYINNNNNENIIKNEFIYLIESLYNIIQNIINSNSPWPNNDELSMADEIIKSIRLFINNNYKFSKDYSKHICDNNCTYYPEDGQCETKDLNNYNFPDIECKVEKYING